MPLKTKNCKYCTVLKANETRQQHTDLDVRLTVAATSALGKRNWAELKSRCAANRSATLFRSFGMRQKGIKGLNERTQSFQSYAH